MTFSSTTWKQSQQSASRSCLIEIQNSMSKLSPLVRTKYAIEHGVWSFFPPEKIPPDGTCEFGTQSLGFMTGTAGFVCYSIESDPTAEFTFRWNIPFFGQALVAAIVPNKLYEIKEKAQLKSLTTVVWKVNEKGVGLLPSSRIQDNSKSLATSSIVDTSWKDQLNSAARSIIFTLDNRSRYEFSRKDQEIWAGGWALFPPERIERDSVSKFAAHSRGIMSGVWGKLVYNFHGLPNTLEIQFQNPFVGMATFEAKSDLKHVRISTTFDRNNHTTVTFVIKPRDSKKNQVQAPRNKAKLSILSLSTSLNETTDGVIPTRTRELYNKLNKTEYDIICLQGIFSKEARKALDIFKDSFPYLADASKTENFTGVPEHGMAILSTFPIIKQTFIAFGNGVEFDTSRMKGIMGVHLDLGSIFPRKSIWIFSTHLQGEPKSDLIEARDHCRRIRKDQLKTCSQFIYNTISKTPPELVGETGLLVVGDFNVVAEHTQMLPGMNPNTPNELQELSETEKLNLGLDTVSTLANKINNGSFIPLYSEELLSHLDLSQIPNAQLGELYNLIESPRYKLLVLIGIVWLTCESLIIEYLAAQYVQEGELNKVYCNGILVHLRLLFNSPCLDHPPFYMHLVNSQNHENDCFWHYLNQRLQSKFGALKDIHEDNDSTKILKNRLLLCKYQLLRLFESHTGFYLKCASKERLFSYQDTPIITMEDVLCVDINAATPDEDYDTEDEVNEQIGEWDTGKTLFETFRLSKDIKDELISEILKITKMEPTEEYLELINQLACEDLYRKKHPKSVGYTVLGSHNTLIKKKETKQRSNFILSVQDTNGLVSKERTRITNNAPPTKLMQVNVLQCDVLPTGSDSSNQLCPHFGLLAEVGIN